MYPSMSESASARRSRSSSSGIWRRSRRRAASARPMRPIGLGKFSHVYCHRPWRGPARPQAREIHAAVGPGEQITQMRCACGRARLSGEVNDTAPRRPDVGKLRDRDLHGRQMRTNCRESSRIRRIRDHHPGRPPLVRSHGIAAAVPTSAGSSRAHVRVPPMREMLMAGIDSYSRGVEPALPRRSASR